MGQTILLTGATGYVGGSVLEVLLGRGHHVVTLGRRRPDGVAGITDIPADLASPDFRRLLGGVPRVDAVVHLAATPKLAGTSPAEMEQLHVGATTALAAWAKGQGARMLHGSTAFVGPGEDGHLAESAANPARAVGDYERSKSRAEAAVLESGPADAEILRPGIVLPGPGDSPADHLRSPFGMFLAVAPKPPGPLGIRPHPSAPLALVRRADVARFIAGRIESDPVPGGRFWNMIAPCGHSAAEILAAAGYEFPRGSTGRLEPWRRYLEDGRSWDIAGYFAESVRLGCPVYPIALGEILDVPRRIAGGAGPSSGCARGVIGAATP